MFQVVRLCEVHPVTEGDAHIFGRLFPVSFMVFLQREDVGIAGTKQHFLQCTDFVDNFVEETFACHSRLAFDDKQLVRLDEAYVKFIVMLDDAV